MKRRLVPILLAAAAAIWTMPGPAQTVPAASTREAPLNESQREALQAIVANAAREARDGDTAVESAADTNRLLKAQTAAIQALAAQIRRLEARVTQLEQQR